ncbi:MAG: hypothetical protein ABIH03_04915, partial [Pseudomonadota bacterium]
MSEKPILFSAPMVRAILDGRKTMTRRVALPRHDDKTPCEHWEPSQDRTCMQRHCEHGSEGLYSKYGSNGDRLWVKETFACGSDSWVPHGNWKDGASAEIIYVSDESRKCQPCNRDQYRWWSKHSGRNHGKGNMPSIYMPRWASRITLEIVSVHAERLRDITEPDAVAEGIEGPSDTPFCLGDCRTAYGKFHELWDSINAERGFGWDVNPF